MRLSSVTNLIFGLEIAVVVFATFLAILFCTGLLQSSHARSDQVVDMTLLQNRFGPYVVTFDRKPVKISYSLSTTERDCFVTSLWPFSDCGLRTACHGTVVPNNYNKINTRLEMHTRCNFTGYIRAHYILL